MGVGVLGGLVSPPFPHILLFVFYDLFHFCFCTVSFFKKNMGDYCPASSYTIIFFVILLSLQFIELFHFSRGQGIHLYFSILGIKNEYAHV